MMMRSSRVREETPQPTMRVTDGSSALSMIYREETRRNMPLRADRTHTFTLMCMRGNQHWGPRTDARASEASGRALSGIADSSL